MSKQDWTQSCSKCRMVTQLCNLTTRSGNMCHNEQSQTEMGEEEGLKPCLSSSNSVLE